MHDLLQGGRPGDRRGFIHKKLLGVVGAIGIPGISGAARLASSFLAGGRRNPRFLQARAVQQARVLRSTRFPRATLPGAVGPGGLAGLLGARGGVTGAAPDPAGKDCPGSGSCCKEEGGTGHTNKSGYFVQTVPGDPARGGTWVPAHTVCVSNRRRNFFNGRSNSIALSRLTGWARNTKRLRKAVKALEVASR